MTNEEWAKMKEMLDMMEAEIQAAHRKYFQEDCKCECKGECNGECNSNRLKAHELLDVFDLAGRLTVRKLLDVVDLETRVDLAIDDWHLSGTVEALVEALNDETLNATVCSISAGPMNLDRLDIIVARDDRKEAENDG